MNTWQTLRSWKFYLEALASLSLILTAAFFITTMNKQQMVSDSLRQADAVSHHIDQAESQAALLEEPSTQVTSTWYLENLSSVYLGPLASMKQAFNNNQERINSVMAEAQILQANKLNLINGITEMESSILDFKQNSPANLSRSEVSYLAAATAWLSQLKTAIYMGNLDAKSIENLNLLTQDMQGENLKNASFAEGMGVELATFMGTTQNFLDSRALYQTQYDKAINSLQGLKATAQNNTTQWAASAYQSITLLWIACFLGISLTGLLFWKMFHNKNFALMLANSSDEAKLIENSVFVNQVEELLGAVDKNWVDSRQENTILNATASVNEDVKRNISQLTRDIKTRNSHSRDLFSNVLSQMTRLRKRVNQHIICREDIEALEDSILKMHHHLMMDNKSVSDDLSSVENSMYSLNSDISQLQKIMNRVIQDSRQLLKMRTNIEESEKMAQSI